MDAFSRGTQHWLDEIAALERSDGSDAIDTAVCSSFVSTYDCSGETVTKKTWIEPL